jgi:hypothetical protein
VIIARERPPCLPIIMVIEGHPYLPIIIAIDGPLCLNIIKAIEGPPYLPIIMVIVEGPT